MQTSSAGFLCTRASPMLEKMSLWRHLVLCRGGPRVGRSTFLQGTLWETDGHHKVIQHRALWQLHQSHIILECVGVILGMKKDVFDPEMLFSLVWPMSPMFTWARRRRMRHGGREDKVTLHSLSARCLSQSMFPALTLIHLSRVILSYLLFPMYSHGLPLLFFFMSWSHCFILLIPKFITTCLNHISILLDHVLPPPWSLSTSWV